jgi:acyl-CoA synthetase (NDP forming)
VISMNQVNVLTKDSIPEFLDIFKTTKTPKPPKPQNPMMMESE